MPRRASLAFWKHCFGAIPSFPTAAVDQGSPFQLSSTSTPCRSWSGSRRGTSRSRTTGGQDPAASKGDTATIRQYFPLFCQPRYRWACHGLGACVAVDGASLFARPEPVVTRDVAKSPRWLVRPSWSGYVQTSSNIVLVLPSGASLSPFEAANYHAIWGERARQTSKPSPRAANLAAVCNKADPRTMKFPKRFPSPPF